MTANPRPNHDDLNQTSAQRGSDTLHSRVYALLIGFCSMVCARGVELRRQRGANHMISSSSSAASSSSSWRCNSS